LAGKPAGKRVLGKPRRLENNITMDFREITYIVRKGGG
jgi:hypothetical protein